MAQPPISLLPDTLDLQLYGGDAVRLEMTVTNDVGDAVPLTGDIDAQIRYSRINPDVLVSFAADLTDAASGVVILSLTGAQTATLHGVSPSLVEHFSGVWDVQWTPTSGGPITVVQGDVESELDVTRTP